MREYLTLGPTPCGEDCAQVGNDDYDDRSREETRRYIEQLERLFPDRPEGVAFRGKSFPHDLGSYREVVVTYDDDVEEQVAFAFKVEGNLPESWDD